VAKTLGGHFGYEKKNNLFLSFTEKGGKKK